MFVCVICNRSLYKRTVKRYDELKNYEIVHNIFYNSSNTDESMYICIKLVIKVLKKKALPCQAVTNNNSNYKSMFSCLKKKALPPQYNDIRRLEQVLISRRILFKKIAIIPKGQAPKLKGAICNIPIETEKVCNTLPRPSDDNGLILLKLKRKLEYHGHQYFEPVRPDFVNSILLYLKNNNHLYQDLNIEMANLTNELTCFTADTNDETNSSSNEDPSVDFHIDCEIFNNKCQLDANEEGENSHDADRTAANETIMISNCKYVLEGSNFSAAPGEGKTPISVLDDDYIH